MDELEVTQQEVNAAVEAGVLLTDPNSDLLEVFRKHADGIKSLNVLMGLLKSGKLGFSINGPKPTQPAPAKPEGKKK